MIMLNPDEEYYKKFPDDKTEIFQRHSLVAYLYLLDKLPLGKPEDLITQK